MPVLEALLDEHTAIEKVVVARTAQGEVVDRIVALARHRGVSVERADARQVTHLSRNGRHDQGVVIDIVSPGLVEIDEWLATRGGPLSLLLLDGLTNPANVGMIIRTWVAAGLDGVVLPRAGSPDIGPLLVKASAGVALRATVLRAPTAADATEALRDAGITVIGLRATGGTSLWDADPPDRAAYVLGNETSGVSVEPDVWWSIPLAPGSESLNVASAAAVLAFDLARRAGA
jgi:23S rRNA (guanosine2251-2'-O)-methyltransferase